MVAIPANTRRRRLIKIIAMGAVTVPLVDAMLTGIARAAEMVSESDPAALALKYKADAKKALERKDLTAFCDNCTLYTGKPDGANGPCAALANRLVAAKGWCTSWEGY